MDDKTDSTFSVRGDFLKLFDLITDYLFVVDLKGTLLRVNRALTNRLGYRAGDLVGRSAETLFLIDKTKENDRMVEDNPDDQVEIYAAPLVSRTGELIPIETTITPLTWNGRKVLFCQSRDVSSRLALEQALEACDSKYRRLVDNAVEGLAVVQDERWVWVNPKMADLCRTTVAEMTGAPLSDYLHPDDRATVIERQRRRLAGEDLPSVHDFRLIGRTGQAVWVVLSAVKIDWQGRPAILCFLTDVTQRQAAKEMAVEMSIYYQALFNSTMEAVVCIENGRVVTANQSAADMFGYDPDELIGLEPGNLIASECRELALGNLARGYEQLYEAVGLKKKGETFPIMLRGKTITVQGRKVRISMGWDLSGRKKAMLEQTAAQDIFRAIPVGLFLYQHQPPDKLILIYGNPASERITGLKARDWIGREFNDIWPEARADGTTEAFLNVVRTGRTYESEQISYDHNLIKKAVLVRAFVMSGSRLGATVEDVTERRRGQEEKEQLAAQLRQAQKMEALGVLAGGIAHDFNNILTSIIGYSELNIKDLEADSPTGRRAANIFQAGLRARELVNQILTFSRQGDSEKEVINLASLVDEVMKMIRGGTPASVSINKLLDSERLFIRGNSGQIHQLLVNLCTNAVDAMGEAGGLLTVALSEERLTETTRLGAFTLRPGRYAVLSTADNGPGVAEDILDRIFDPFFTTKPRGRGIGMGLAVVHGVVKSHHGAVAVSSAPGRGTVFRVFLPAVQEAADQPPAERLEDPLGGAERILFVDDEQAIVDLVEEMLTSLGYRMDVFTSSLQAWEAYRLHPENYDLVITDWNMPEINGPELIRRIKEIRPRAAAVLCTGYNDPVRESGIRELGVNQVIGKPFVFSKLAWAVRQALDGDGE